MVRDTHIADFAFALLHDRQTQENSAETQQKRKAKHGQNRRKARICVGIHGN